MSYSRAQHIDAACMVRVNILVWSGGNIPLENRSLDDKVIINSMPADVLKSSELEKSVECDYISISAC